MYKDDIESLIDVMCGSEGFGGEHRDTLFKLTEFALQHAEERPKKKVIDMSVLIKSGIDCEFSDYSDFRSVDVGVMLDISADGDYFVCKENLKTYRFSRPRMDHPHAWDGRMDNCPILDGFEVEVHFRLLEPEVFTTPLRDEFSGNWNHKFRSEGCPEFDVINFKILRKLDDYIYPWEQE